MSKARNRIRSMLSLSGQTRLVGGTAISVLGAALALIAIPVGQSAAASATYSVIPVQSSASGSFFAISCPLSDACIAVGSIGYNGTGVLAETLTDGAWSPVTLPTTGLQGPTLNDIWCASMSSCISVGTDSTSHGDTAFVETLENGAWSLTTQGLDPAGFTNTSLTAVSCSAITTCVVAGTYIDPQGNADLFFDALSGTTWTPTTVPPPTGSIYESVVSLQCFSATSCFGVGASDPTNDTTNPLLFSLSGTTWSSMPLGVAGDDLRSLSCPSSTSCMAMGYEGSGQGLTETFSNGAWTRSLIPIPTGTSMNGMVGVSCPLSVSSCVAVGGYRKPANNSTPSTLIETLSGGSWTPTTGIDPSDGYGFPEGIACPTVTTCTGVGSLYTSNPQPEPMAIESIQPSTPVVSITSNTTVEVGTPITGTASASAGPGIKGVIVYYTNDATGTSGYVLANCSACGAGHTAVAWSYPSSASGPLSVGRYALTVQAVDVDNTFGPGLGATLVVVPVPTATITTMSGLSQLGETIRGTASDVGGPGIDSLVLYYTNVLTNESGAVAAVCSGCGIGGSSVTWSVTVPTDGIPGIYEFTAQAVDLYSDFGPGSNQITQIVA